MTVTGDKFVSTRLDVPSGTKGAVLLVGSAACMLAVVSVVEKVAECRRGGVTQ